MNVPAKALRHRGTASGLFMRHNREMKSVFSALITLALVLRSSRRPPPPVVSPLQPSIVTRGQAIVTARPDRAFVTIAAESRSRNSAEAQKQNAAAMTAVLQKIEQAGVPKDAIRTIGYDLQPEFDYANGRQTFRNYLARNTVEVRLDDIDRVGVVIDAAGRRRRDDDYRHPVRRAQSRRARARRAAAGGRRRARARRRGGRGRRREHRSRRAHRRRRRTVEPPRPMMRMAAQAVERDVPTPVEPSTIEIQRAR